MTVPAALAPLLDQPQRSAVLSDFDGTLAPIVDDPAAARPLGEVPAVLAGLARRLARVAVISGRPARFLVEHVGGESVSIWGLYGLERAEGGEVLPVPEAEAWRATVGEAVEQARRELGAEVNVEDKGLTFTLHFRTAPHLASLAEGWARRTADATGLLVHPARMSYELRPPVPHGKGKVVEQAARGLGAVCFFGDDHGDLDGFDALDRLEAAGAVVARIGVFSEESPVELLERADATVDGPEGVLSVLSLLLEALE